MKTSDIMCILKILTDLRFTKQRIKKKHFFKSCLLCFNSKNVLTEHKKVCLNINGAQFVKSQKGTTEFKNYFKHKKLWSAESYEGCYSKNYQDYVPCSFAYKLVCIDDKSSKSVVVLEAKMLFVNLLKQLLKSISIVKK